MYPWIREPNELPNNFSLAFSCLKSTERRLSKLGLEYSIKYNDQIQDMLNRGVAFKLDKSSINNYKVLYNICLIMKSTNLAVHQLL